MEGNCLGDETLTDIYKSFEVGLLFVAVLVK
jgi:hypothetical protein